MPDHLAPRFRILPVAGSRNVTACDHIPQGDMMPQQHFFFLWNSLRNLFIQNLRHDFPETVLRMSIKELHFSGLHRRKTTQDQVFQNFHHTLVEIHGFVVLTPLFFRLFFFFFRRIDSPAIGQSCHMRNVTSQIMCQLLLAHTPLPVMTKGGRKFIRASFPRPR